MNRAQETLKEIIEKVVNECKEEGDVKVRVCFIGYRDYTDRHRFSHIEFTDNVESVKDFIKNQRADGGGDEAEDVQGGLKLTLMQDWTAEATKRCVLICDAPPHGKKYYDHANDNYPAGSKEGFQIEDLMKEFCKKEIEF